MSVVVSFRLSNQFYGLPVEQVVEMLQMVMPREMPDLPNGMIGVIDYRGQVIPLLDLRQILELPTATISLNTPILVVKAGNNLFAVLVDQVQGVVEVHFEPLDMVQSGESQRPLVNRMGKFEDQLIFGIDLENLKKRYVLTGV